jgi:hypothetical protein
MSISRLQPMPTNTIWKKEPSMGEGRHEEDEKI